MGKSERELLETVARDHREPNLRRAYFSAFHPIEHSPFFELPAEDPSRALRLYRADFMIRDYGFSFAELPFDEQGLLPRDKTPKGSWAEQHLHEPVEVNRAVASSCCVPKSADKIIAMRRETRLRDLSQLKVLVLR